MSKNKYKNVIIYDAFKYAKTTFNHYFFRKMIIEKEYILLEKINIHKIIINIPRSEELSPK